MIDYRRAKFYKSQIPLETQPYTRIWSQTPFSWVDTLLTTDERVVQFLP
jgi:hypothetical protein